MNRSSFLVITGFVISLSLLVWVFSQLDWEAFLAAIKNVRFSWLAFAGCTIIVGIMLRSLRWNLISNVAPDKYWYFWRATSLGYLGNLIYPARAGEVLRIAAICKLAGIPAGQAVTSAVVDRVADGLMLAIFILLVLQTHGPPGLSTWILISVSGVFIVAAVGLAILSLIGEQFQPRLKGLARYLPLTFTTRLDAWYTQAIKGLRSLNSLQLLIAGISLSFIIFLVDYTAIYLVIIAFEWSLPFMAALTVGVLIAVGSSLPSAPGFVGIYQIACVLSLKSYGINESGAIAYSLVLQLLIWTIIGIQGILVALGSGLWLFRDLKNTRSIST